jgi:arsenite methyltransferase
LAVTNQRIGEAPLRRTTTPISECAFRTFPNKNAAAGGFTRVLRPNGGMGLADLTHSGEVPPELQEMPAWIADALSIDEYAHYLRNAGLTVDRIEPDDDALTTLVHDICTSCSRLSSW